MIFHKDLTGAGISRLCKKYFSDQLRSGNYFFSDNRLMVYLNYHEESEAVILAEVHGQGGSIEKAKAALVDFLIAAFGGRI